MRYINPGYAELLDVDGGTTISDAAYNPTHGVALYQPTDNDGVTLGSTVTELYGEFDFYIPSSFGNLPSNYFLKVGIYNGGSDGSTAGFTGFAIHANIRDGVPDVEHIVDFTERIRFDGNEYFLMSNSVELTPRSLRQVIKMTRWY